MSRRSAPVIAAVLLVLVCLLALREPRNGPSTPPPPPPAHAAGLRESVPHADPDSEPATAGEPDGATAGGRTTGAVSSRARAAAGPERPTLTGRVVAADGTPAAGAVVALYGSQAGLLREGVRQKRWGTRAPRRVRTGKDGRYRFEPSDLASMWPAEWKVVRAERGNTASRALSVVPGLTGTGMPDLVLAPAFSPTGSVVDDQGRAVAGARVELTFRGPRDGGTVRAIDVADWSDAEGRVRFALVEDRDDWSVELEVEHREFCDVERSVPLAEVRAPFRVVLRGGLAVRGMLLQPDGSPAVGYRVEVGRSGERLGYSSVAVTDDAGAFLAPGVPVRGAALGFDKDYGNLTHYVDVPAGEDGETVDLGKVRLPGGKPVRGVVLGEDGRPVKCRVKLCRSETYGDWMKPTSRDGARFTFAAVPPGEYIAKADHGDWFDSVRGRVDGVRPGDEKLVVRLSKARSVLLRFRAADRPEKPLEVRGAVIWIEGGGRGGWARAASRFRFYAERGTDEFTPGVDAPGYRSERLPPVRVLPVREVVVDVFLTKE